MAQHANRDVRAARLARFGGGAAPEAAVQSAAAADERHFKLGVIADVQYADADNGSDFSGKHTRHFRNTLNVLESAVDRWNAEEVDAALNLGDLIDGCNARAGATHSAMARVLASLSRLRPGARRFDAMGNHELYNFHRGDVDRVALQLFSTGDASYGSAVLTPSWELLVLDCYEHALIGFPMGHPNYLAAVEVMKENNPAVLDAGRPRDWAAGLPAEMQRFTPVNGAASPAQLAWLRGALSVAQAAGRSVLIATHIPIYQPATNPRTVAWNGDELLAVLHSFPETVVAVLAGHDHCGGYAVDEAGIHHVTLCSPLHTAPPERDCCAVLELVSGGGCARLRLHGYACAESGREWVGRPYRSLLLEKGAVNEPEP